MRRRHRQARATQQSHEMHDVVSERWRFHVRSDRCGEALRDLGGVHAREIVLVLQQNA
jgi:hypothetical protein